MMSNVNRPDQISYRIMVPKEVEGLLVPVPASATHIAYSSIRLESTWMALGQAAGTAAHLAIAGGQRLRDIRPERIQRLLLKQDQVLTFFTDLDRRHPAHQAMQLLGTKGFFREYQSKPDDPVTPCQAREWIWLALRTAGVREPSPACESGMEKESIARLRKMVDAAAARLGVPDVKFDGAATRGALCITLDRMLEKAGY